MKISSLLSPELIKMDLENTNKNDVLQEIVDVLDTNDKVSSNEEFYKTILAREEKSSTGVGNGVAIPHGKSDVVNEPALVFAKSDTGVDFDSLDGKPAKIFFMIAVPEGKNDEHLKVLSQLSRKLIHADFREALLAANSKEEVIEVIKENE